jgi:hypothetical protein
MKRCVLGGGGGSVGEVCKQRKRRTHGSVNHQRNCLHDPQLALTYLDGRKALGRDVLHRVDALEEGRDVRVAAPLGLVVVHAVCVRGGKKKSKQRGSGSKSVSSCRA